MKAKCERCGDKSYREVRVYNGTMTLCKKCFGSYRYWTYKWGAEP